MSIETTLFDLTGKVAIVTGSSKGIGRAMATAMAEHGARVVISSRKADACDAVTAEINERCKDGSGEAITVPAHIGRKEDLQHLVDETRRCWGQIDVLVCNAAVNPHYGASRDIPDSAFEKILDCNIKSNHWLAHMVLPEMVERRDGAILIVSSVGAFRASTVIGTYNISKAADLALVRNLAAEYGRHNVRVNAIAPGLIKTDFSRALWEDEKTVGRATASTPLARIGEPEEMGGVAVFLASRAGSFASGQTFTIDGGQTIT